MNSFDSKTLTLFMPRLRLDPIQAGHASTLQRLFWDPELYRYLPQDPPLETELVERCQKWSTRTSPDGKEIWLNWIAYDQDTEEPVAHFQATVKPDQSALIAYLVPRLHQRKGYAFEGLQAVLKFLKDSAKTQVVRADIDTRNTASIRLVEKLGLIQKQRLNQADFFKGESSDEWVYEKSLRDY